MIRVMVDLRFQWEKHRDGGKTHENADNEAKEKCVCLSRISPVSSRVADLVYEVC